MKNFRYTKDQPLFATIAGTDIALGKNDEQLLDETNLQIANWVATGVLVETPSKLAPVSKG